MLTPVTTVADMGGDLTRGDRLRIYASAALAVVQVWFPRKRPRGEAEHLADLLIARESSPSTDGADR